MQLYQTNELKIYNSITGEKEVFKPITEGYVGMYVCGPTVYGDPHLGHARPAITFDVVFRYLKHSDYKVRYVRNITDAGHLENDADEGEDKISKKVDCILVLAWNFFDDIKKNNKSLCKKFVNIKDLEKNNIN